MDKLIHCPAATAPRPDPEPGADRGCAQRSRVACPELKTDQAFLDLQKELAATENRIALARDYYNSIATHYNTSLAHFPDSAVAALAMVKAQPLLAAADFEREAVPVRFAS